MRLRPSRVLLPVVALGLLVSVPLKAWTIVSNHSQQGPEAEVALADALEQAGYRTSYEDRVLGRRAVVAEAGSCRIWLGIVSGEGWHRDIAVKSASPQEEVAFFFKGHAYPDQPIWDTWLDEKAAVLARSFALPLHPSPVVAAHLGPGCAIDREGLAQRLNAPSDGQGKGPAERM